MKWFNGNQVRWINTITVPIGGWIKRLTFSAATTAIQRMFSWRDDLKAPWLAAGSSTKLFGASYNNVLGTYTNYDITPAGLGTNPGSLLGFGRDFFGSGFFGQDAVSVPPDITGSWFMDNFGKLLTAVHSQDGRLVSWDPATPATVAAPVAPGVAPIDNTLVIATEEEHLMVMGGLNNPRRVKWCSRRLIGDWIPTESNSAGGFDLKSNGAIITACKVQGGILVLTDADVHLIEYVGPPNYYGRRKISEEGGIVGKYAISPILGGAIWVSQSNAWTYVGGAVAKLPCTVHTEIFENSDMTVPENTHLGVNEYAQELWMMYPEKGSSTPNRYAAMSYDETPYWAIGSIPRTAWLNPVWQTRPLACNGIDMYEHEIGMLADGVSRKNDIFIETGAIEFNEGDVNTKVDRIYPDVGAEGPGEEGDPDAIRLLFTLQQAPNARKREVGPIALTNPKGFVTVRFRARQFYMKIIQTKDNFWKLGKLRLRVRMKEKR